MTRSGQTTKAKAAPKTEGGAVLKKKKRRNDEETRVVYGAYLHKVLQSVYDPKTDKIGISGAAMQVVDGLVRDAEKRLIEKTMELAKLQKKATISAKHVESAVALILPKEMSTMAMTEGQKALQKFSSKP